MAMVKPVQSSNSDYSQTYSLTSTEFGNNHLRDVSFSSYLNPAEESFVHKLVQPGRSLGFNAEPKAGHLCYLGPKEDDRELGVFEAEKYFNGEIESEDSPKIGTPSKKVIHLEHVKDEPEEEPVRDIVIEPVRPRVRVGTPSIHSESSMNSQSALLRNIPRNLSRKRGNKMNRTRRSLLAGIGCKCSCSDNGSVDVADNENITNFSSSLEAKPSNVGVFPTRNSVQVSDPWVSEEIPAHKSGKNGNFVQKASFDLPSLKTDDVEVTPKKSLELFGSPLLGRKGIRKETVNLERRLTMLGTWDANPRKEAESEALNDTASDASSDLFEIESLTGKVNSYLTRQTSDVTSDCAMPTTARYAPSEVSIEWSVVMASAADYSVLSDSEEAASGQMEAARRSAYTKNGTGEVPRRRHGSSILLGCKNQKSVRVAGDAHKSSNKRFGMDPRIGSGRRSELSPNPVARFQAHGVRSQVREARFAPIVHRKISDIH